MIEYDIEMANCADQLQNDQCFRCELGYWFNESTSTCDLGTSAISDTEPTTNCVEY